VVYVEEVWDLISVEDKNVSRPKILVNLIRPLYVAVILIIFFRHFNIIVISVSQSFLSDVLMLLFADNETDKANKENAQARENTSGEQCQCKQCSRFRDRSSG